MANPHPETPNLGMPLLTLGIFNIGKTIKAALNKLDTVLGDIPSTDVLDGAGGAPVEGNLADKLAAMEARIVALESA